MGKNKNQFLIWVLALVAGVLLSAAWSNDQKVLGREAILKQQPSPFTTVRVSLKCEDEKQENCSYIAIVNLPLYYGGIQLPDIRCPKCLSHVEWWIVRDRKNY